MRSVDQDLIYEQIGREIALCRTAVGLSQADLARLIGLTRSSISNIEKGRQKMLVHTLLEIAAWLRVPAARLLPEKPAATSRAEYRVFSGTELSSAERDQISAIVSQMESPG